MSVPALAAGAAGVWIWDNFSEDILKRVPAEAWKYVRWAKAASTYRENLHQRYKTIQIFGQPEPVALESIFTHVRFLEEPQAFQRYDVLALQEAVTENHASLRQMLHRTTREDVEIVEGKDLVAREEAHRLLILGKPGAGKTTFLQHLALAATKGTLEKLPIFVTLREWRDVGDYESLLDFIARQFDICDFPNARPVVDFFLRHVDTLVLFDGLDEIPEEDDRRGQAIDALRDFARKYPRPQILITCRVAATDYTFEGFKFVELADFHEGQMHAFVRKWFKDEDELAEQFWEEYQQDKNEGLRELGRVPLLLALLCIGYEETLAFPNRRVDLYEEALDALLKKWDASRRIRRDEIYQHLALGRKQQLLAELAATYFHDGRYFFKQRELAGYIADYLRKLPDAPKADVNGEAVLKAIEAQHGILVERARYIHAFAHLTFQEYYTAKYVVDNALEGTILRLMEHIAEDRWREVFLLAASLLPKADIFFKHFLDVLDTLVTGDDVLLEFLAWVVRKAGSVENSHKPVDVRWFYISRARALDRALDRDLARARALARALDLDRDRARDLDLDRNLARVYALARAYALAFNFLLVHYLACAHKSAGALGEIALAQALEELEIPAEDAELEAWEVFAADLQGLMIEHRDIGHDWAFTIEQDQTLDRYLYATDLLLDCLDVAYVSDREAIEERLLRPPPSVEA